ncbi:MAG TPA: hypothetical protein VHX86_02635 [Tepidisphaeraceae bacterium]|nr:hypothetical protein [Tepidisphaeraceae bacterium]
MNFIFQRLALTVATIALCSTAVWAAGPSTQTEAAEPRLSFQTSAYWRPRLNVDADVAMVYGVSPTTADRMKSWRDHGYIINLMTGVAWGEYQDYLFGRFDGKNHEDEAQTTRDGRRLGHGKDVYYMSPGPAYGAYLSMLAKKAIDDGAEALYLEEPEFWTAAGYGPRFKVEWQQYYHEPWRDPESSPDAQYRSSKLKYYLYRRALADVFKFVREYGRSTHKDIKCYVATHSLINYADWGIVSPESSLLEVGCDGYIAQVWTGTARTPNVLDGVKAERTFETAFLEYGQMQNLVRASGRDMWFLNDPVEDNAHHTWADYRYNWQSTLTASLLQPEVYKFETMPWPERVFQGYYPVNAGPEAMHYGISLEYQTELQAVIHALGQMKQPGSAVHWDRRGTAGVGVLVSDTLMFQRAGPQASDPELGQFFGLALPLIDRGVPVEAVQLEDAGIPGFLSNYKMLLLTYDGQKPPRPQLHTALADWVKAGGALVVVDDDKDPYDKVREWWNTGKFHDATPRLDLFRRLGLPAAPDGPQRVGNGIVLYDAQSPAALSHEKGGADVVRHLCITAAKSAGIDWQESPALVLHRGPYVVAAVLPSASEPMELRGHFIPLFDPALPVVNRVVIRPNQRQLLVDLDRLQNARPCVACASGRVVGERREGGNLSFDVSGIDDTPCVIRVACADKPTSVTVEGRSISQGDWSFGDGVLRLHFENSINPQHVTIKY